MSEPAWMSDPPAGADSGVSSSGAEPAKPKAAVGAGMCSTMYACCAACITPRCFKRFLSLWNVVMSGMMGLCSVMTITNVDEANDTDDLFVSLYNFIFAFLLCSYEVTKYFPYPTLHNMLRRYFGFLFFSFSRSTYLVFCAFLQFGLNAPGSCKQSDDDACVDDKDVNNNWLGIMTGLCLLLEALLVVGVQFKSPHMLKEEAKQELPPGQPPGGDLEVSNPPV
eukprot:CAMPEP_0119470940 /NCGR_PEP_ID=MMETSP1344-20130328/3624_1 /TAXON_ID=236787 /ORGANISM="Florenciella parvula, Strain CCMP2471" /LENGTH=222 /DNA_ID=CAMNT_0007503675 /DNA_START=61 /DNA_END=729 /DNA_ORIENTATION=-